MRYLSGLTAFSLLFTISCGRSPQVYIERGNRYFAAKKYEEAGLNYRKAVQKDPQFGEAFYRFGLNELEEKKFPEAYSALTEAALLLPDRTDVQVTLADLAIKAYMGDK